MPFTFVHPGYLLWIKNKWKNVPISAIAISSVVPDFDILFRITDTRIHIFNYGIKDVFLIILPISFFLWLYYELIIKKVYSTIFPFFQSKRHINTNLFSVVLLMIFSIYLHIFLDMISHWNAYNFFLTVGWNTGNKVLSIIAYYFSLYGVGILFSLAGLIMILRYIFIEYKLSINDVIKFRLSKSQIQFGILYAIVVCIFFCIKFYFAIKEHLYFVDIVIINFTGGVLFSFFFTPLLYALIYNSKPNVINS